MTDNPSQIEAFMHCSKCMAELPAFESPMSYQRIQVGWTARGLQVWCVRHDCNVCHIDFEGAQHRAIVDEVGVFPDDQN
jgi:hypothetical protein